MGLVPLSDNIIAITPANTKLVVLPDIKTVSVSAPGPPGPQGPIGPAGGAIIVYDTLGAAINPWVISHNLGRLAHVTIIGADGLRHFADEHQDPPYNVLTIYFGGPFIGKALVG